MVESRRKILFPNVTDEEWNDWHWQVKNRIETLEDLKKYIELTPEEEEGVKACLGTLRMAITPYYLSLIQPGNPHDPVRLAQFAVRVFGCEMNFADPEATARQGIEKLCLFFHSLGMPITFDELGAKAKDIPDMVAHRAEKPGGFPFGGFVKIQPADMEAILRLAAGEAQ